MAGSRNRRTNARASSRGRTSPDNPDRDAVTDRIADLLGPAAVAGARGKTTVRDPRQLKPAELCRVLNSTPLGTCINERRLYAHRSAAGTRILSTVPGAGATKAKSKPIDLLRYAAWLAGERHVTAGSQTVARDAADALGAEPGPTSPATGRDSAASPAAVPAPAPAPGKFPGPGVGLAGYEAHKERARERQANLSRSGRDIAPIPACVNPERRAKAGTKLRLFAETYFPHRFYLGFSPDHLEYWEALEQTVIEGGQLAQAMPRGSGKTTMIEVAAIFAVFYGHRKYVVPLGPTARDALKMLKKIKREIEGNDLLLEDFPEICYPVRRLEGMTNRQRGQHVSGARTHMDWAKDYVILPTIEGSLASGSIIEVRSMTGAIRGMTQTLADGRIVRPDLVLADDIQTKKSARSPSQCQLREETLHGDVLYCAGPDTNIACLITCTVIVKGDVADRILDRTIYPEWRGVRVAMVKKFPTAAAEKLWDQYADLRREGMMNGDHGAAATAFYRKNRKAMDEGCEVYWEARYKKGEISAIQHAMNLRIRDEEAFWNECQNAPREDDEQSQRLKTEEVAAKISGVERLVVPLSAQHVVAYIDIQQKILWYAVGAFGDGFTGAIIDYGAFPDQGRHYFTKRDAKRTLARKYTGAGVEGRTYAGLRDLVDELIGRDWRNEAGVAMPISRILVDAAWGDSTEVVFQFCRESEHKSILMPSIGKGIKATERPMNEWSKKPGDVVGQNWRIQAGSAKRAARSVLIDTNWWKSFYAARLRLAHGDVGSLSLFKASVARHQMFIDHQTAEVPKAKSGLREMQQWELPPGRDNDLFDCAVGCCVAASIAGVTAVGHIPGKKKRKRVKLSELQQRRTA